MQIYGLLPGFFGLPLSFQTQGLAETYPDLNNGDLLLADKYFSAYAKRGEQPETFRTAKSEIIARIKMLARRSGQVLDPQESLKLVARLVNFKEIMRKTRVAPVYFADTRSVTPSISLRQCGGVGLAADVPEEVKVLLDVNYQGVNFLDYVAEHARRAHFVERLSDHIIMLKGDNWAGTSEEITRSVIIDAYDEKNNQFEDARGKAILLLHEVAHIDYFYANAKDVEKQNINQSEKYAYMVSDIYVNATR